MSFVHLKMPVWCLIIGSFFLGGFFCFSSVVEAQVVSSEPWSSVFAPSSHSSSSVDVVPNDPHWDRQWYLRQIGAPVAWKVSTGTEAVVVAIIDGGVDIDHPDLRENIWQNPRESFGDGIDNDRNGYRDDVRGWNFVTDSPDVRPVFRLNQSEDAWGHGTMVASLIGARGNNGVGISGLLWNVRIMPLVVLDANGSGTTEHIIKAIRYAVNMGANVINLSLVGYDRDAALEEMIQRASNAGVVVVAATGNDDRVKRGVDLDDTPAYPVCDPGTQDWVIGVGGTDPLDQKAPYANFGKRCTDLSAPGQALFVARPSYPRVPGASGTVPQYRANVLGTSLAAPLVSGAAALLKSVHRDWTVTQIRMRLYETADPLEEPRGGMKSRLGYGRLNVGRALSTEIPTRMSSSTSSF